MRTRPGPRAVRRGPRCCCRSSHHPAGEEEEEPARPSDGWPPARQSCRASGAGSHASCAARDGGRRDPAAQRCDSSPGSRIGRFAWGCLGQSEISNLSGARCGRRRTVELMAVQMLRPRVALATALVLALEPLAGVGLAGSLALLGGRLGVGTRNALFSVRRRHVHVCHCGDGEGHPGDRTREVSTDALEVSRADSSAVWRAHQIVRWRQRGASRLSSGPLEALGIPYVEASTVKLEMPRGPWCRGMRAADES